MASALAAPAWAQDNVPAEPQAAPQEAEPQAGDIIVRGLRREETLQDTPAAITAFTSEAIESAGIEKPADFMALTSNVNLVETQNAGNAFVIIRGITQARNSEPSVAVVVDGVQQVNPAQFNQELFDIDQIEVLKGPQGGLYGRNAIGGAIIITTKQPTDTLEGRVKVGIDNGFGYSVRGGISGPLAEGIKFRLGGSLVDTNGYIYNPYLKEDADPYRDYAVRGNLLIDPAPGLTIDLRASGAWLRTQALYFNIVTDVNDTHLPVRVNNAGQNDRDMYNLSMKVDYDTGAGTLTSITSYDTLTEVLTGDAFDFLPIDESFFNGLLGFDMNQSQFLDVKAWSQELRFASPTGRRFEWMVGAYAIGTKRFISTGNMVDTGQGVFPVFHHPSTNPINPQATFLADDQDNFAWAGFANATYKFTDQVRVDASLRYDHDRRKNTTLTPTAFLPVVPGFSAGATGDVRRKSYKEWQPKVTLTWEPTRDLTLYGGYSKGFRSGGFNQSGVGAIAAANGIVGVGDTFEAETAETFEAGLKAQLFDRHVTFNASAYTTKSQNSYFFVFLAANSTQNLGNVPEVRLKGFELEATAHPVEGLDLNAGLGVTYSDIKKFPDPTIIGNEAPLISRYTLNLGAQYKKEIGDSGISPLVRIDYRLTGKTWFDIQNSTVRDPVGLVDARAGLNTDHWSITAFANNLFDKKYNAEFSPGGFVFKARPRIYGLEAGYKF
ncbi:TonB-dependent receptor [Sphingomonas sp. dw_22]|uniref:TonB-dependent receptor n=1 Tax=Sphingomonas sp. dw_22 TaxID=2721175 RepID=UPI001BD3FD7F|nr:TonB-dependent receptor [Sphingomonas sp. dw_22]